MNRTIFVVLFCFLPSCGPDGPVVDLFVSSTHAVPSELDRITVQISAASPDGRICQENPILFFLTEQDDLPIHVRIERGAIFTESVMYEIIGYHDGIARFGPFISWEYWPVRDEHSVEISLDHGCFSKGESLCSENQMCFEGDCINLSTFLPEEYLSEWPELGCLR